MRVKVGALLATFVVALVGAAVATSKSAGGPSAAAMVAKYSGPVAWSAPGPKINAANAKGKTVAYIPIIGNIPYTQEVSGAFREAMKVVGRVEGIAFVRFDERDVVRHKLVQQIVRAYEEYTNGDRQTSGTAPATRE